MLANAYATAAYESIEAGKDPKAVFARLEEILAAKGHQKLRTAIYRTLVQLAEAREAAAKPAVIVAREGDLTACKAEIAAALAEVHGNQSPVTTINEALTGGFIVRHEGKQVDASYKTKLLSLYQNIIN